MKERSNKTIICSVFFLDIIEYSKKSVAEQISLKERFNAFLSTAIQSVPLSDRIILDTGDGAAVTFIGDLEDALQAALSMRNSLLSEDDAFEDNKLMVRMGINLGPARLVKDINGQVNIVGDGINVSQRVMGFADSGQILVSRSYYDAVSRISAEFAGLFHYQGSKTDKHVREHEVYAIGYPGDMQVNRATVDRRLAIGNVIKLIAQQRDRVQDIWRSQLPKIKDFYHEKLSLFVQLQAKNRLLLIALMIAPMVLILFFVTKISLKSEQPAVVPVAIELQQSTSKVDDVVVDHEAKPTKKQKMVTTPTKIVAENKNKESSTAKSVDKVDTLLGSTKTVGKSGSADGMGEVMLIVKPWGEIYLDGKKQGISPPLMTLKMSVGQHELEIRNGALPEYKATIKVQDTEKLTVKHIFN
ncbi:MAG: hypothetical protein RLZZ144_474 [Pseudomonadota bacterium]|jgi:hypothetical protein